MQSGHKCRDDTKRCSSVCGAVGKRSLALRGSKKGKKCSRRCMQWRRGTPVGRPGEGSPALRGGSQGASLRDAERGPTGDTELRLRVIPVQEGNRALTPSGRALVPSPGAPPRQTLPQDAPFDGVHFKPQDGVIDSDVLKKGSKNSSSLRQAERPGGG